MCRWPPPIQSHPRKRFYFRPVPGPALLMQGVFAREARSVVLYYVALFASREIPANEELSYDYGGHCCAEDCSGSAVL